jgi:hypothetical protein
LEREPLIAEAWALKEAFRSIYRAPTGARRSAASTTSSAQTNEQRSPPSLPSPTSRGSGVPSCSPSSTNPTTNGYAEGIINRVKVSKRRAYGMPSFDGFRERVLLACP